MTGLFDQGTVRGRIAAALRANIFGRGLATAVQLVSPAVFLWCWSVDLYGEWLLLTALPAALGASDLGFCTAAANDLTMRATRGDTDGARSVFQHILGLVLITGGILIAVVLGLVLSVDVASQLGLAAITGDEARLILVILTLQIALGLPGELLLGGFRSGHRFAEGLMIANMMFLAEAGLSMAALLGIGTPLAVALAVLTGQALRIGVMARVMTRRLRWPGMLRPRFSPAEYRRLLPPAIGFASIQLARAGINHGMVILVGLLADPRLVVMFTTTRTATRLISTAAGLVVNSISSEMTVAWAGGGQALLRTLLFGAGQVAVWSGLGAALLLLIGRESLAHWWLHDAINLDLSLMLPLVAAEMASAVGQSAFVVITATNRHAQIALGSCLLTAGGLCVAALIIPVIGVAGAGVGVMVTETVVLAITVQIATRQAGTSSAVFLAQTLIPPWRSWRLPS